MPTEFAARVFALVAGTDAVGFSRLFALQGRMRFGSAAPMTGPEEIAAGIGAFFTTIKGCATTSSASGTPAPTPSSRRRSTTSG
ncbi:hypothetical protein ACRAWF_04390 [Streptomyces sp. L7]